MDGRKQKKYRHENYAHAHVDAEEDQDAESVAQDVGHWWGQDVAGTIMHDYAIHALSISQIQNQNHLSQVHPVNLVRRDGVYCTTTTPSI